MGFFDLIGAGVFLYGVIHTLLLCISDCDLRLKFAEIFGKKIGVFRIASIKFEILISYLRSPPRKSGVGRGRIKWHRGALVPLASKRWGKIGHFLSEEG